MIELTLVCSFECFCTYVLYWCVWIPTSYLLGCFCCLSLYPIKPKDYTLCPTFWMWHARSCSSITLFMLLPLHRILLSPSIFKSVFIFQSPAQVLSPLGSLQNSTGIDLISSLRIYLKHTILVHIPLIILFILWFYL